MSTNTSIELEPLLAEFLLHPERGRQQLLEKSLNRLRRLANRILTQSFPAIRQQHDLDSVVNELWIRMQQAMSSVNPPTLEDYFKFAAHKVRQILLDLIAREERAMLNRHHRANASNDSRNLQSVEVECLTDDPVRLSAWTQFHQQVNQLPEEERRVFELHYYLDLTQAEIAGVLSMQPRQVSRLWVSALEQLRKACSWLLPMLG
ncbi:MAG: sigma-70 family RNA polymerase sigma factor [Pirellulales bacterium]